MGRYSRLLAGQMADLGGVTAGQRVLDVGCGPGALTAELVERVGAANVAAVDPSMSFVEAARARFPGATVLQASAEHLPFPDGEFDAAIAQLVVHFMADPIGWVDRDEAGHASRWRRRSVRLGSRRRDGSARPVLASGPSARPHGRGRIRPARGARGSPGRAVRGCGPSRDLSLQSSQPTSSTRHSRAGGSRSPPASGRPARTSPASTRYIAPSCAKPAIACCQPDRSSIPARAWAVRGVA